MDKNLIFLSGIGGTGKTSIISYLKSNFKNSFYFQNSITRDFYQQNNINAETNMREMSNKEKKEFQINLFDYYNEKVTDNILNTDRNIIADRCIIDYFTYCIYYGDLTLNEYKYLELKVTKFFNLLKTHFSMRICYLDFPVPWIKDNDDNFRDNSYGKNLVLRHIMKGELDRHVSYTTIPTHDKFEKVLCPNQRGLKILDLLTA